MRLSSNEARRPEATSKFRRLAFLESFMQAMNISYKDMADLIGIKQPAVSHMFFSTVDDTRLSYCFKVIEHYGYILDIAMTRDAAESKGLKIVNIEDFLYIPKDVEIVPPRLTPVLLAIKRYGISKSDLAKLMNLKYATVRNLFLKDDIYLSRLYQIAHVCKFDMRISIRPKQSQFIDNSGLRNPRVVTDINIVKEVEM